MPFQHANLSRASDTNNRIADDFPPSGAQRTEVSGSTAPRTEEYMVSQLNDANPQSSVQSDSSVPRGAAHVIYNILGSLLILGLGVFGLVYFGRSPEVPTETSSSDASVAPLVETSEISAREEPFHLDINGEAATWRVLTVGAEVTGRILNKSDVSRSGTFVNQGDVLFEIDPVNYRLDLERLEARVMQAQEELRAIEVDRENTELLRRLAEEDQTLQAQHLKRIRELNRQGASSDAELDAATRQELTARNSLQLQTNQLNALIQSKRTREASLKLAQAELERTQVDLQRCTVRSPITGRIVDDLKEEGDYVKPGDTLVHVSDSGRMEVKCSLKDEELSWIWQQEKNQNPIPIETSETSHALNKNQNASDGPTPSNANASDPEERKKDPFQMPKVPCEIAFEFEGVETIWDGYLSRYEGTGMDRTTRMFPCRVIVDQPERTRVRGNNGSLPVSPPTLLSGMYVTVRIPIQSSVPLIEVPAEALRPGEQIWIVRSGKLQVISVRLVRVEGDTALIRHQEERILPGDRVVISPLASVVDGMEVLQQ